MSAFTSRVTQALRLAAAPRWAPGAIILLGLAAAALEAAGLYLFIPLVQSLGGEASTGGPRLPAALEPPSGSGWTALLVAALCLSILAKNVLGFFGGYLARLVDGLVAHQLRVRVLDQTFSSCIDDRPGARMTDVVTTLANHTWKVSQALSLVWRLAICLVTGAVFLTLLGSISLRLTGLAVAMIAVTALLVQLATRRAETLGGAVVEENKQFGLRMWETAGALQLIRSLGRESYELERFRDVSDRMRRRILGLDLLWAIPGPIAEVMGALLIGGLILAGVALNVPLAALAAFLVALYRLQGPVREFLACKVALEGLGPALDDVDSFLSETSIPLLAPGSQPAERLVRGLEFRDVTFRYAAAEAPALQDVGFTLPARQTTAIVGASGAGKSTLMSLIARLRDPDSGQILVDGTPLTALDVASWRARLSLMPQEAQLFNATVAENIGYGDLAAGPAAIRRAAEIAGAASFIEALPDRYETQLGDRGVRLSGGQRQRIALARTILRDPELLLLDEPTNALDPETERAFQAALARFSQGRTVVVIAHRLSTVRSADQIIVLDSGRLVEVGPPAELLARPGRFAQLYGLATDETREVA